MEGRVETLTCAWLHMIFRFLDDGERIYLLHAAYTVPEAHDYRILAMEWMIWLPAPVFCLQRAVL